MGNLNSKHFKFRYIYGFFKKSTLKVCLLIVYFKIEENNCKIL